MAHGDAVVDGDGVEFLGDTAGLLDFAGDQLAEVFQILVGEFAVFFPDLPDVLLEQYREGKRLPQNG